MNLWLDDVRLSPSDNPAYCDEPWITAKSYKEAVFRVGCH